MLLFQTFFEFVLMLYCYNTFQGYGEGRDPAYMFNPATFCIYVSVPSHEPVIQWFSFVDVLHICFSFSFCTKIRLLIFSFKFFYIFHFGTFYSWLCGMGSLLKAVRWPVVVNFCGFFFLLWRLVSLAIIPYLLFLYMYDWDRRPVSNRRPFLKSTSKADVTIK